MVKRSERLVLNGSIAGLSKISNQFSTENVSELIQEFFEIVSSCVIDHGGQVADFMDSMLGTLAHHSCVELQRRLKIFDWQ